MPEHKNTSTNANVMRRVQHVHCVGIGGTGMSGVAEVLHNLGYKVSGSDKVASRITRHLSSLNIKIEFEHRAEQINGADVIVFSTAVAKDNPELQAARSKGIPVIPRAEMLAELMRFKHGIAVAGTHGKTTTTSLIASILAEDKFDPTYVIGGLLNASNSHARLGDGKYLIAEADESDASFLHLQPMISIITNIDADHLNHYNGDISYLEKNFLEFLHHLPFYGLAIICTDDPGAKKLTEKIERSFSTYGINAEADYFAHDISYREGKSYFTVSRKHCPNWLKITLNLPGRHNILNALAAIALSHELNVSDAAIMHALAEFKGIARRCEILGELNIQGKHALLIDDYAHHPREIAEMLYTVKNGWPNKRIVIIFQPHRYTRTISLFEDFCAILSEADKLLMLEVYSAGEKPIANADSRTLCNAIRHKGQVDPIFVTEREQIFSLLENIIADNDVILILGAGDIASVSASLLQRYR